MTIGPIIVNAKSVSGTGLGKFLREEYPPVEAYVEGILCSEGSGFLGGPEKVGKSFYALEEALCLALGLPVCGRFKVPKRRRVYFVAVEDSPGRVQRRIRAILRGHGLDPDDPALLADLDACFVMRAIRRGSLDDPPFVAMLLDVIRDFKPDVIYLDVLRKLSSMTDEAVIAFLEAFDDFRDRGTVTRAVHHYRKAQATKRFGRGSMEIAGSYRLGAWAEDSLFFDVRADGVTVVTAQSKDMAPRPPFTLRLDTEGPPDEPILVRLVAEDTESTTARTGGRPPKPIRANILSAFPSLKRTEPGKGGEGKAGVTLAAIVSASGASAKPARAEVERLVAAGLLLKVGRKASQAILYDLPIDQALGKDAKA